MAVVNLDERRRLRIGGSEAAAACGLDPHRSRVALWAERTGRIAREPSEAMAWGKLLEPVVYAELERRGFELLPAPVEGFTCDSPAWLSGHPDGFAVVGGARGLLEIKTAGSYAGREWASGDTAPLAYLVQVQHYLALTGLEVALLACLVGGQRLETIYVERDDRAIDRIIEGEAAFVEYLRTDQPPPPDGSQSAHEAIAALYPHSQAGQVVRFGRAEWDAYRELKARREQRDAIDRQAKELEQRLKLAMGEAEAAISPHDEICAKWTTYERTDLDRTALRKARPEIAAEFATTKTVRRFTLE